MSGTLSPRLFSFPDGRVLTVEQAEEASLAEIRDLNLRAIEKGQKRVPEQPMGFNYFKWRSFVGLMRPGDSLRWRNTRKGTHEAAGFQIVRGPKIVASFVVKVK